jgi:tetratricopeptide (TPR) repeat protein
MARRLNSHETRWWRGSGISLGLLLLVPASAFGQRLRPPLSNMEEHENGIVDGRVQAVNGRAISTTVTLKLVTVAGEVVSETPATTDGQFEFSSLPHIAYVLMVSADGFESTQQSVDLSRSGGKITLNIFLQPAAKAPPPMIESETLTDGQAPKTARKEFEKGEQALAKKDFNGARGHLAKAAKEFPCYARAQTELATILSAQGQNAEAETALKKAVECDPGYADPYLQLGMVYNSEKNFRASIAEFTEGIRHAPSAWQFYYQMGNAHYGLNQFQDAEHDLLKARSFAPPEQEDIQVKLADVYLKEGQFDKAYAEMQACVARNPQGRFAKKIKDIMHQMESSGAVHPAQSLP